jgi:hypothetical protein
MIVAEFRPRVRERAMCKVKPGVNGGQEVQFGRREWLGIASLVLVITGAVTGAGVIATKYFVRMEIKSALSEHSTEPHPITGKRLSDLEAKHK